MPFRGFRHSLPVAALALMAAVSTNAHAGACVSDLTEARALATPMNGTLMVPDGAIITADWEGPVMVAPAATAILAGRIEGPVAIGRAARVEIRERLWAPMLVQGAACVELKSRAPAITAQASSRVTAHARLGSVDLGPAARLTAHERVEGLKSGPSSRAILHKRLGSADLAPASRVVAHDRVDAASGFGTIVLRDSGQVETMTLTVKVVDETAPADAAADQVDAEPKQAE